LKDVERKNGMLQIKGTTTWRRHWPSTIIVSNMVLLISGKATTNIEETEIAEYYRWRDLTPEEEFEEYNS
jgi:hypothetical protein